MWLRTLALYGLTWIFLIKYRPASAQDCDNGKANLEIDLPPPDEFLCVEPRLRPTRKLPHISTIYPQQPAEHICMDKPLRYNHTIPNSGAHRPVGAESGEYLYCPPQRWLNNLKDGALVLLYHPCVIKASRRSLVNMAHSCLFHYIITPHPQLQQDRPFALVSWGRTLEMSHVTTAGVCEFLVAENSKLKHTKNKKRPKYNLFLTNIAPAGQKVGATATKNDSAKDLKSCCMKVLSAHGETETRKRRAALLSSQSEAATENDAENVSEKMEPTQRTNITKDKDAHAADLHVISLLSAANAEETGVKKHTTKPEATAQEKAGRTPDPKSRKKSAQKHRIKTDAGDQGDGGDCGLQGRCDGGVAAKAEAVTPRVGGPVLPEQEPHGAGTGTGLRMRTQRTDEAVWAAAALGFLLVLLTLSVLHTRLYRNWRTPPSLYWQQTQQDYESVGDIIRRRLKMVGRRKRRASQSRRQECPLLPNSSTDNDSD